MEDFIKIPIMWTESEDGGKILDAESMYEEFETQLENLEVQ